MAKKRVVEKPMEVTLPIKWNLPDSMNSVYASNILVQLLENEFKLTFYESKPKIRVGPADTIEAEVRADCVASIIIHPNKIPLFIKALIGQYEIYSKRIKPKEEKA